MDAQTLFYIEIICGIISLVIFYYIIKGAVKSAFLEAMEERDRRVSLTDLQRLEEDFKKDKLGKKDYEIRKRELAIIK